MDTSLETTFDAAYFQRVVAFGVSRRLSSASRTSSGIADVAAEAVEAMREFARIAKQRVLDGSVPDVVSGYLDVSPTARELFAALAVSTSRPAVCAGALDCLLAIAEYATPAGSSNHGPARTACAVSAAKSIVKDVVKGRANSVSDVLSHRGAGLEASNANKALVLLNRVASSHPLLAKETVSRIDLGARSIAPVLCNKAAKATRHSFCELLRTLATSGDRDVIWTLSTRMRQALISCLRAYSPTLDFEAVPSAEVDTIVAILSAMETNILSCPNHQVAKSAFAPPILDSIAHIAVEGSVGSLSLCDIARALLLRVIERPDVVATAHVVRVLLDLPVVNLQDKLKLVIDCISACPRAARMLLQTGPYVLSTPRLSSAWLSSCAVICKCVRQLRTPTPVFRRTSFFERCWNHESDLVRHKGILIAAYLCKLVLEQPNATKIARIYLPPCQQVETLLKKSRGSEPYAHQLYGAYRILFRQDFEDSKVDAIRIAAEAGFGKSPHVLESVIRSTLRRSPSEALSTIFHRHIFSFLLQERQNSELVHDVLRATGLFPPCTEHEIYLWALAASHIAQSLNEMREFESFVAQAWEKPYILYDDTYPSGHISLLAASALRRIQKLSSNPAVDLSTPNHRGVTLGSFHHILITGLSLAERTSRKESEISRCLRAISLENESINLFAKLPRRSVIEPLNDLCRARRPCPGADVISDLLVEKEEDEAASRPSAASHVWRLVDEVDKDRMYMALLGAVGRKFGRKELLEVPALGAARLALLIRLSEVDRARAGSILRPYVDSQTREIADLQSARHVADANAVALYLCLSHMPLALDMRHRILLAMLSMIAEDNIPASLHNTVFVVLNNFIGDLSQETDVGGVVPPLVLHLLALISGPRSIDTCDVLDSLLRLLSHSDVGTRALSRFSVDRSFKELTQFELSSLNFAAARRLALICSVVPGIMRYICRAFLMQSFDNIGELLPLVKQLLGCSKLHDGERRKLSELVQVHFFENGFRSMETDRSERSRGPVISDNSMSDMVYAVLASSIQLCKTSKEVFNSFLLKAASIAQQGYLPTSFEGSLLCAIYRAWGLEPLALCHHFAEERARVLDLLASLLDLLTKRADALSLASELLIACRSGAVIHGAGVHEIEKLEQSITNYVMKAVEFLHVDERCVVALAAAFEFDLVLDDAAVLVLRKVVDYGENREKLCGGNSWIANLSAVVCAVTRRLSARKMDDGIARSIISLEALFSEQGLYQGTFSSEDLSIRLAMEQLASLLKVADARRKFKLPEMRNNLFHVRSTQVIQLLDTKRIGNTADLILEQTPEVSEKRQFSADVLSLPSTDYEPIFVLRVLQKACSEASQTPTSAVLDLGSLIRVGLVDVAICGLASSSRQIRVHAYAALAALRRAVGPSSSVPPDFAAALYRNRRQLAFALELLQASIREPIVRILPLFASFFRASLSVLLSPTHKVNKELMRFLLRSPLQDVHDAEGVCYLLREPSKHCHELSLHIMQRGIHSPEDHHVARRRRFYDRALTLLDLRETVVATLLPVVGRLKGQIAADLVRSLGILPWLASDPVQDRPGANVNNDLDLVTRLADSLPEGALPSRYAPSFVQTLEILSANKNADTLRVDNATAAICRLTPRVLRLLNFDDRKHMAAGLVTHVHARHLQRPTPELIQDAIMACCTREEQGPTFPTTSKDRHAIQAFIADQLLKNPRLNTINVRNALACLALDGHQMTIWGLVACVSVLDQAALTLTLPQLAESIPGSVEEDALDLSIDYSWNDVLSDETKLSVTELLLSRPFVS